MATNPCPGIKITRLSYDRGSATRFTIPTAHHFVRVPTAEFRQLGKIRRSDQEAMDTLALSIRTLNRYPGGRPHGAPVRADGGLRRFRQRQRSGSASRQQRFDWIPRAVSPSTVWRFVIGAGNQFSHAASQAVAERPQGYNLSPLLAEWAWARRNLMQAIGHEVKRRQPHASICYISSEKFTNEMINSLRYDKMISFRDKFRQR